MPIYDFQIESANEYKKLTPGTVAHRQHFRGMQNREPVIVMMDSLLHYAKRHNERYGSPLSDDSVLGPYWLDAAKGIRGLLNGEGDFDGGTVEAVFWAAMDEAGFTEADL